ncbi:MAG: TIGR04282 family arsenosugar biosynthesis glycosyltransferase [Gammaproteobacteria bacterium]|nr:TIGR04282 family arsenosugar biosynthesis glycosyltransferase [Gammaproteobacteria bacterium]
MRTEKRTVRVVIFAKAPSPGFAKTRLIASLGADGAAELAKQMLRHCITQALAAEVGPVEICTTPSIDDHAWQSIQLPTGVTISAQGDGDLGVRMARAAQRVIAQGESLLLIGTDIPEIDASLLCQAADLLHDADATLYPAADGGYTLLGLNRFDAHIFTDVPWSVSTTAKITLNRFAELGWNVRLGPTLHDIDEPEDLQWIPESWQIHALRD